MKNESLNKRRASYSREGQHIPQGLRVPIGEALKKRDIWEMKQGWQTQLNSVLALGLFSKINIVTRKARPGGQ